MASPPTVVLITGASSGIGRAAAIAWGRKGAGVVLNARSEAKLREVAKEVEAAGGKAVVSAGDVGNRGDMRAAVAAAESTFGRLDIAVANAGFGIYAPVAEITDADFDTIFRTNVKGVLWTLQESLPLLRRSRGRFAIVSSILGKASVPWSALYCMTKHALSALGDSARLELEREGVSVTVVGPGLTATDFQANAMSRLGEVPAKSNVTGWTAEKVARSLIRAVEKRKREVYLTFQGRALVWARSRMPSLADWGIRRWMKSREKTK